MDYRSALQSALTRLSQFLADGATPQEAARFVLALQWCPLAGRAYVGLCHHIEGLAEEGTFGEALFEELCAA